MTILSRLSSFLTLFATTGASDDCALQKEEPEAIEASGSSDPSVILFAAFTAIPAPKCS